MQRLRIIYTLFFLLFFNALLMADGYSAYIHSEYGAIEKHSANKISLCAKVSRYFDSEDAIEAKDYISISPKHYFEVYFEYRKICVRGLKPQTDYTLKINHNIPLGEVYLSKDYTLKGKTGDYTPSFSFPQSGYILPAYAEVSIPVETRNVKTLSVSLYRINKNNLIHSINESGLFRSLNKYKLNKIEEEEGYKLWTKILPIKLKPNTTQTTAIPIGDFLKKREPGVYIVHAIMLDDQGEEIYEYTAKTQWFMVSDIGLFTLKSEKGLTLFTRSLKKATLLDDVKIELIAKNNERLYTTVTKEGKAFIPNALLQGKKGLSPKAIYAYGKKDDFCVLDLEKSAHDLSDRGVGGRDNPRYYDAFIYSNRGIFKPDESITIHALVRDKLSIAKEGLDISLKVFDSRQVEVYTQKLTTDTLGHLSTDIKIASTASTGKWRVSLYAGETTPIGTLKFLVEDFVPPKIKITVQNKLKRLRPQESTALDLKVNYLSGGAVSNAEVEINTILHLAKHPFKKYKKYLFGDMKEVFKNQSLKRLQYKTNAKGTVKIPFKIQASNIKSSLPLAAHIDIVVNEVGGRPVHKILESFYEDKPLYIGLKPQFPKDSVDMSSHAVFNLITLAQNERVAETLNYRLIEEHTHWHWRSWDDDWEYYETYSDASELEKGEISTDKNKVNVLKLPKLTWGSYRLEIRSQKDASLLTSYRFSSGYSLGSNKSSPDKLPLSIDKKQYNIGDTLRLNITAKFTGPAQVSIAHHNIVETKMLILKAGKKTEISFIVDKRWGNSAYILASAFRKGSKRLGANRAIGVMPIDIRHPEQQLNLTLRHKPKASSLSKVKVKITAKEAAGTKTAFTLAAVDEGVLNLTRYTVPNPSKHFLGQQKLGIEIRDIYANLIEAKGTHAKFNVGSDDDEEEQINGTVVSNKRKVVSLFTKVLHFDKKGEAEVWLDIPDYQGALKIMALAWNKKATGVASDLLLVKDSISTEYYMPRFLSIGDEAQTLLTIDFDEVAPEGDYTIKVTSQGGVSTDKNTFTFTRKGKKEAKFTQAINLYATKYEEGNITISVYKKDVRFTTKSWQLGIRTKYPQAYVRKMGLLDVNATFDTNTTVNHKVWSSIHTVALNLSGQPLLPLRSLKTELIDYSGRCAEQTTSRAMPWLFTKPTAASKTLIKRAIARLLTYQKVNGGFGLWRTSRVSVWVSSYVLDFLTRAKKAGYPIPQTNIDLGLNWLETHLDKWSNHRYIHEANVYALYVLSREGRTLMSEMKFYAQDAKSKVQTSYAFAHLASAFAYVGEKKLAHEMFDAAQKALIQNQGYYYYNYGGNLRDNTALIFLMRESKLNISWQNHFERLVSQVKKRSYFSTQELSLLLKLALSVGTNDTKVALSLLVNTKPLKVKNTYKNEANNLQSLNTVTNKSKAKLWYDLSFKATPVSSSYLQSNNNGFSLSKELFSLDGEKIDISKVKQNQKIVVVLRGRVQHENIENPLITDWLPAGFELENPTITGIDTSTALSWLEAQSPTQNRAYRGDRFEAALDAENLKEHTFILAYVARAVTKGKFTLGAGLIEDMYQPHYRAFSTFYTQALRIGEPLKVIPKATPVTKTIQESLKEQNTTIVLDEKVYAKLFKNRFTALDSYNIVQLNILRNALFASLGLNFEKTNPMLHKVFSAFAWYKPETEKSSTLYSKMTRVQKQNIQTLLKEEKRRGGTLVLADFYRVYHLPLKEKSLQGYDKKQLRILRNSLLARYGYDYSKRSKSLHTVYQYMPWYQPKDINASEILDVQMRPYEKANVLLILKREKEL